MTRRQHATALIILAALAAFAVAEKLIPDAITTSVELCLRCFGIGWILAIVWLLILLANYLDRGHHG